MPEAAVDENHLPTPWENKIGLARKVFAVKPEPEAKAVNETSNREFGLHTFRPYGAHILRAPLGCDLIRHQSMCPAFRRIAASSGVAG